MCENAIQKEVALMPLHLRIPPEKEDMIIRASKKAGKTKSAYIIEAIDEKIGVI